jgi:hypothetical protein
MPRRLPRKLLDPANPGVPDHWKSALEVHCWLLSAVFPNYQQGVTEAPILVVGAGRGGTTLLTACLSGHSRVKMDSEFGARAYLVGEALDPGENKLAAFRAACDEKVTEAAPLIWGNKVTTEQIGRSDVEAFATATRGYRIVFITRDGRTCVASKMRRTGQSIERAVAKWRYSIHALRRLRELGAITAMLTFEALVTEPEATLRTLCQMLSLSFEPAMLEQTNSSLMSKYRRPGFEASRAKISEVSAEYVAAMRPELDYCGYP